MNSNELFVIKKSSKLYKFYNFVSKVPGYSTLTPKEHSSYRYWEDDYKSHTAIFRDICTFLRVNLFYLLATPVFLFTLTLIVGMFVIGPLLVIVNQFYTLDVGLGFLQLGLTFLTTYLVGGLILICGSWFVELKTYIENKIYDVEDSKPSNIFIQSIKDKHNQICRQIKVED